MATANGVPGSSQLWRPYLPSPKRPPPTCPHCFKSFPTAWKLNRHLAIHSPHPPQFRCPQCPATFTHSRSLQNHLLTHTPTRPFSCHTCSASFKRPDHLKGHLATVHHHPPPAKLSNTCPHCGQQCRDQGRLNRHRLIHTGVKPWCCQICGWRFTTKEQLKIHARAHQRLTTKRRYVRGRGGIEVKGMSTLCNSLLSRK